MKPNKFAQPNKFDCNFVEKQLKCFGLTEYKSLVDQGFPNRFEFDRLLDTYKISVISQDTLVCRVKLHRKQFHISLLLRSVGLDENDFKLGNTRVCFRPLKSHILDKILCPKDDEISEIKKTHEKKLSVLRLWSYLVEEVLKYPSIGTISQYVQFNFV